MASCSKGSLPKGQAVEQTTFKKYNIKIYIIRRASARTFFTGHWKCTWRKDDTNAVDDDLETPSKKSRVEKDDIDNEDTSSGSSSEGESEEDYDVINIDNI